MRVGRWILLSLAALVLIGCTGKTAENQVTEAPLPTTTNPTESVAQTMNSKKPVTVKSGSFMAGEHSTQGTARIVTQNGKFFLELDQGFKTSNLGPDLFVILHRSSDVIGSTKPPAYSLKSGDYVLLAPLQKFSGAQRYAIPAKVNLANYKSAVIWCRQFNATFGAAKLISQ